MTGKSHAQLIDFEPAAGVQRRRVEFSFDPGDVPRDWFDGDPFTSTFLDALSLLFPEGERFFVDAVKRYRHRVVDPKLRRDVEGFIGQEAMHGKGHRRFNALLAQHGYDVAPELEAHVRQVLDRARGRLPHRWQLAVTVALEHFTAILAEMLLGEARVRRDMHPAVRSLWVWHALEETEHKAVAFEVYRLAGGNYAERCLVMAGTTLLFFYQVLHLHSRLMAARGIRRRPWTWARGVTRMWIWPGLFRRLIPGYLDYFRPGFHPDDRDSTGLVERWQNELLGERGWLRGGSPS